MNLDLSSEQFGDEPIAKKSSGCGRGCLIVGAVLTVLLVIGSIIIVANFRTIAAKAVAYIIKKTIEESDLPADQKQKLVSRVDRLRDDFTEGKISNEQLERIAKELMDSPLLPVGMVMFIESAHLEPSGLSDEEKAEAKITLRRLSRGVIEKKISHHKLEPMFAVISEPDGEGKTKLKRKVTDTELRDFLKLAHREVEAKNISSEPLDIDLAKELDEAIERGMAEPIEKPF